MRSPFKGTLIVFFVTGAVFASWGSRIPAVQDELGLSPGELAVAILGIEGGAVVGLPLGGALTARLGSRASLRPALVAYAAAMTLVGLAPSLATLAVALALTAAANSVLDVAMNAQGVELERRFRRPLLSRLHAGHSFGVLGGGLIGTAAAAAGIGPATHFALVAVAGLGAGLLATASLVDEPRSAGPAFARPTGRLAALAAIAFCAFLVDGTAINWSAVHVREEGAGPALAAAGFTAFALAVALSRLAGDRALARFGRAKTVRGAATVTAAGGALIVLAPAPEAAVVAWALLGAGIAIVAPAVLGAAPAAATSGDTARSSGETTPSRGDTARSPGVAIAAVTTVGYLGSFTGPPAIGALAGAVGLDAALGLLAGGAAAATLLAARALRGTSGASGPSPPPR
jgi:MFS family permease